MGIIKQGILGGFSNKVGAVVGSSWKGIAVMKSKPISVANPRTAGQVAQRTKLKTLTQFLSPILADMIKPLNDRFAVKQSGFNLVTKRNLQWVSDLGVINYQNITLSEGKLSTPGLSNPLAEAGDTFVSVSWNTDLNNQYDLDNDDVYIAVLNQTENVWLGASSGYVRSDGSGDVNFSADLVAGDLIRIYVAFRRADGTYVSTSANISVTVSV